MLRPIPTPIEVDPTIRTTPALVRCETKNRGRYRSLLHADEERFSDNFEATACSAILFHNWANGQTAANTPRSTMTIPKIRWSKELHPIADSEDRLDEATQLDRRFEKQSSRRRALIYKGQIRFAGIMVAPSIHCKMRSQRSNSAVAHTIRCRLDQQQTMLARNRQWASSSLRPDLTDANAPRVELSMAKLTLSYRPPAISLPAQCC